jgi:CelD/BcsL family acetyltransferase involved in cellulose biosynthesis
MLTTTECRGLEGLHSLREHWIPLAERTGHYFHEFEWFVAFVTHDYRPVDELVFVVVRQPDGTVVGIVPLEERIEHFRRVPVRIWATVGSRLGDVMLFASGSDILCASPEMALPVLNAVVRHLAARKPANPLLLVGRMTAEAVALEACRKFPRSAHYTRGSVDWIPTDRSYPELYAGLSRKFRASLRNTGNRAAAQGAVEFRMTGADAPDFAEARDDFKRVEASGWKGAAEKGGALVTAQSSSQRDFVDQVYSGKAGGAFVHRLLLNGQCIAALLGMRLAHTVAVPKIGYDETFRRFGPGHLLLQDLFQRCCDAPEILKVDMVSHTDWVASWEPAVEPHYWFYLPVRPIAALLPLALLKLPRRDK